MVTLNLYKIKACINGEQQPQTVYININLINSIYEEVDKYYDYTNVVVSMNNGNYYTIPYASATTFLAEMSKLMGELI